MRTRTTIRRPNMLVVLLLGVALSACGEPPLAITLPERGDSPLADLAGVVEQPEILIAQLDKFAADGQDIVVLTYETDAASCGEAFRAGRAFVEQWDADAALVAVAPPGRFDDPTADRCAGLQPRDDFAVGRGVREEITEVIWPPLFEDSDFDTMFEVGAQLLAAELSGGTDDD